MRGKMSHRSVYIRGSAEWEVTGGYLEGLQWQDLSDPFGPLSMDRCWLGYDRLGPRLPGHAAGKGRGKIMNEKRY